MANRLKVRERLQMAKGKLQAYEGRLRELEGRLKGLRSTLKNLDGSVKALEPRVRKALDQTRVVARGVHAGIKAGAAKYRGTRRRA